MKSKFIFLCLILGLSHFAYADFEPPSSAALPPQTVAQEPPVHDNPETLQNKPGDLGVPGSLENEVDKTMQNQMPNPANEPGALPTDGF